jgi:predicted phosphohydrolase
MKIKLISDLHIEYHAYKDIPLEDSLETILLVPGDICAAGRVSSYIDFIKTHSKNYSKVIIVPGNHEYYNGSFDSGSDFINEMVDCFANVVLLNPGKIVIGDVTFIGTTLWTDFDGADPLAMIAAKQGMNDYNFITQPNGIRITPKDVLDIHLREKDWLERAVAMANGKVVVMTHHAPSQLSAAPRWQGHPCNPCFYVDMENFILDNPKIKVWVHGHMHNNADYMIGDTRILCNPKGYGNENPEFDYNLIFQI